MTNYILVGQPEPVREANKRVYLNQYRPIEESYNPHRFLGLQKIVHNQCNRVHLSYWGSPVVEKKEKPLRNKKDGSFSVIASNLSDVQDLLGRAQDKGLSVSGDTSCKPGASLGSISNIQVNDVVTFGTSTRFDVNWVRRNGYAFENNLIPVYDVVSDWGKIKKAVDEMADEKKILKNAKVRPVERTYRELKLNLVAEKQISDEKKEDLVRQSLPQVVTVGSQFVKIGYTFIPVSDFAPTVIELIVCR